MNYSEVRRLDSAEKRLAATEYMIEATHEEEFGVWKRFAEDGKHTWTQCHGWIVTVGEVWIGAESSKLERMPVTVSLSFVLFDGHLICFYEAQSQVVDHRMVEKYVRAGGRRHTNATNFHNCVLDLERGDRPAKDLPKSHDAKEKP